MAAWRLGAGRARKEDPVSAAAGVLWRAGLGEQVTAGQPLLELHTDDADRIRGRWRRWRAHSASTPTTEPLPLILDRIPTDTAPPARGATSPPAAGLASRDRARRSPAGPGSTDPDAAISIRGLVKRYGEFIAVDGLDLDIRRGEIFALLGPNGAGKTTTVEICEGYRTPDAGEVRVLGEDPAGARGRGRRGWASCCSPAPVTASSPAANCCRRRRRTTRIRATPMRSWRWSASPRR